MPFFRCRFPSLYRFAALLALMATLVPMGTILAHNPATPQLYAHICGIDRPGGHQGKAPAHKMPVCPIGQSLHLLGGGFMQPDTPAVVDVGFVVANYLSANADFLLKRAVTPQYRSRAPPAIA